MTSPFKSGEWLVAQKLNRELDKARRGMKSLGTSPMSGSSPISFPNATGAALRRGDIASIESGLGTYVTGGAYSAVMKAVDADSTYSSVRFAMESVQEGTVGNFAHGGVLKAIVDIDNAAHEYAEWADGDTYLTSVEQVTDYRIVMVGEVITGSQKMCVIECRGGGGDVPLVKTTAAPVGDSVTVQYIDSDGVASGSVFTVKTLPSV